MLRIKESTLSSSLLFCKFPECTGPPPPLQLLTPHPTPAQMGHGSCAHLVAMLNADLAKGHLFSWDPSRLRVLHGRGLGQTWDAVDQFSLVVSFYQGISESEHSSRSVPAPTSLPMQKSPLGPPPPPCPLFSALNVRRVASSVETKPHFFFTF